MYNQYIYITQPSSSVQHEPAHLIHVEYEVQLTNIFKAFIQRFHKHLQNRKNSSKKYFETAIQTDNIKYDVTILNDCWCLLFLKYFHLFLCFHFHVLK